MLVIGGQGKLVTGHRVNHGHVVTLVGPAQRTGSRVAHRLEHDGVLAGSIPLDQGHAESAGEGGLVLS